MSAVGTSAGVEVNAASPVFDRNNVTAALCRASNPGTEYYGALVTGLSSPQFTNNVIRDASCTATEHSLHFDKVNAPNFGRGQRGRGFRTDARRSGHAGGDQLLGGVHRMPAHSLSLCRRAP